MESTPLTPEEPKEIAEQRRGVRNRPRDFAEWPSLMRIDRQRLALWYATGEWTRIGPRRIRIRI